MIYFRLCIRTRTRTRNNITFVELLNLESHVYRSILLVVAYRHRLVRSIKIYNRHFSNAHIIHDCLCFLKGCLNSFKTRISINQLCVIHSCKTSILIRCKCKFICKILFYLSTIVTSLRKHTQCICTCIRIPNLQKITRHH